MRYLTIVEADERPHRVGREQRQQRLRRAPAALLREGCVSDPEHEAVAPQRVVDAQRDAPPVAREPLRSSTATRSARIVTASSSTRALSGRMP